MPTDKRKPTKRRPTSKRSSISGKPPSKPPHKRRKKNNKQSLTPEEIALDGSDSDDEDYQPNLQLEEQELDDMRKEDPTDRTSSRPGPSANNSRPAPPTNTQSNATKRKHPAKTVPPRIPITTSLTLENYSTNGRQLGRPALERMLNDPKRKTQNRPPSNVLGEAQALQGYYTMDKMSLSLVGNTSLATLESALFEGPISRDRNGYTTWMSYSLANTVEISMPAGRQPDGFAEHNQNCRKWTELTDPEKEIFQPKLFEKLAYAHFSNIATAVSDEERATEEEVTQYMIHFTQLANLVKVSKHLQSGVLGQTIAKSLAVIEKRGREEIGKVATQESIRTKLTNLLNHEIRKNLPKPPEGPKQDVYPKTPNPHATIASRLFQGLQLAVRQATDSQVTQEMLSIGAKGGRLTDKQVKTWIDDIEEGRYSIYIATNNG
ncbi:uncharacterized protein MELLADRAFT_76369 [Melampsora larici-populina 98AG31]|uniref:Uncharacterized protein n=1 Tax=Melampsora larici-populina (strain 98AG31 / pathotype 3-4-7) TaxID=747676 RepID=F4R4K1_MELLP|nr:uncharacterized protein MELLADRAFT_76369 [Melampsora larici-populina 98AG31]EGG12824.1 hypothetical protein MELLADRAFT_76369 [Melampsora larici-populina 98AG31]